MELSGKYTPQDFEKQIYSEWETKRYFHGEAHSDKPPFSIVLPPPNITGALHMGHAVALEPEFGIVLCAGRDL